MEMLLLDVVINVEAGALPPVPMNYFSQLFFFFSLCLPLPSLSKKEILK
jgi:hypothetical protein